jgi:small subunit ribosomal protein S15
MSHIDKEAIKKEFRRHENDSGSSDVQIALLTKRIEALTEHLKLHRKDHSSRYGLIKMVSSRRSLLDYLKRDNEKRYQQLIKKLKIRY